MKSALVLACDNRFFPYACVVARQALELARAQFPVVVVGDGISDRNAELGMRFVGLGMILTDASYLLGDTVFSVDEQVTRASYLRLFIDGIPALADMSRIVYLDCDVSILTDITPLFEIAMNAPMIATYDMPTLAWRSHQTRLPMPEGAPYFNAGVLVLDMDAIRRGHLFEKARRFAIENCRVSDQDALNVVFAGAWQTLDWRWNAISYRREWFAGREPFIRHFTQRKPWGPAKFGIEPRFIGEWRENLRASPWPEAFVEEPIMTALGSLLRPPAEHLRDGIKRALYSGAFGMRYAKMDRLSKMAAGIAGTLARIEEDAAKGYLARSFPEDTIVVLG